MRIRVSIGVVGMNSVGEQGMLTERQVFLDLPRIPDMTKPQDVSVHEAVHALVREAMERALVVVKDEAMGTFGVPHVGTREFLG
jgi:hypothetical protein